MERKEAIRKYKEAHIPAGVFCVRTAETVFLGSSVNVSAMLNRVRFQLENGSHPNRKLQQVWNERGAAACTLETLEPPKEPAGDPAEDLATLESMWRESLGRSGVAVEPIEPSRRRR